VLDAYFYQVWTKAVKEDMRTRVYSRLERKVQGLVMDPLLQHPQL